MEEDPSLLTEASYGALKHRGRFQMRCGGLCCGDRCVVRTPRGVEFGVLTSDPAPAEGEEDGDELDGEVLRGVTERDDERYEEMQRRTLEEHFRYCEERIRERELPMRLVHAEPLFGGGKIVFYFVADGRVDFRELVKDLARHLRTRIELRQIGVRDEARLVGDFEYCGRDLCCASWMREILPVTMRMAKNQKSTLDPDKISGRCSRLKCCLRFEDEVYSELRSRMPRVGRMVGTEKGPAKVLAVDALAGRVTVQLESRERLTLGFDEVSWPES